MPLPPSCRDLSPAVFGCVAALWDGLDNGTFDRDCGILICSRCGNSGTEFIVVEGEFVCPRCKKKALHFLIEKLRRRQEAVKEVRDQLVLYGVFDE